MKLLLLLTTAAVCYAADISIDLGLDTPTSLRRGRKLARVDCNGPFSEAHSCPEDTTRYTCAEGDQVVCCTWTNLPVASPRDFRRQFRINRLVAEFRTDRTGVCTIDLDDESSSEDLLDEDLRLDEDSSDELDEDSSEDILDELLDEEAEEFNFDEEDFDEEFDDEEFTQGSD